MATKTKAELEARIAELEKYIAENQQAGQTAAPSSPIVVSTPSTDVEIVYTSHSLGAMEGTTFNLQASVYGERFVLSRSQFDELVGKYRSWFNAGILAVSAKNVDIAAAKGLPTDKDNGLSVEELRSMGRMTPEQIEKLWNKAGTEVQHMSIVTYFKEKYLEGDENYRDRARIDCLNRLTNGGFDAESQAVGGRRVKLQPIDLVTATED